MDNNIYSIKLEQILRIHKHDGVTSPILTLPVITAAPTDVPAEGTQRVYKSGGVRRLYIYIDGGWHYSTLT